MSSLPFAITMIPILSLFIFFLYIFLTKKIYKKNIIKNLRFKNRLREYDEQLNLYLCILNNLKDGLSIIDRNKNVLFMNSAFKDNIRSAEFSGNVKKFEFLMRNFELNSVIDNMISDESCDSVEKKISYFDKADEKTVNCFIFKIKGTGELAVIVRDITYIQKIENVRSTFIQNISHEIKTPITAIMGFVETLKNGAIDDKANGIKFLNIIDHHTKRLNYLIDDLITLTKIETNRSPVKFENIDIRYVIENSLLLFDREIKDKKLDVSMDIGTEPFMSDLPKINQIIINLIQNAVKYTENGGAIKIKSFIIDLAAAYDFVSEPEGTSILWNSLTRSEKQKEFLFFSVEDTGIGVSYPNLLRLGERFFRVDSSHTTEYKGTGLGLAIIKHTVKLLNGAAVIKSNLGNGFSFAFVVPLSPHLAEQ